MEAGEGFISSVVDNYGLFQWIKSVLAEGAFLYQNV